VTTSRKTVRQIRKRLLAPSAQAQTSRPAIRGDGGKFYDENKKSGEKQIPQQRVAEEPEGTWIFRMAHGQGLAPARQRFRIKGVSGPGDGVSAQVEAQGAAKRAAQEREHVAPARDEPADAHDGNKTEQTEQNLAHRPRVAELRRMVVVEPQVGQHESEERYKPPPPVVEVNRAAECQRRNRRYVGKCRLIGAQYAPKGG